MIYLYIKTHRKTGLKYLGKTKKDPYQYEGSGTLWLHHIKKHGNDVATEILKECKDNSEVKEWGLYYSNLWNIVERAEWANLKPELGEGGSVPGIPSKYKGKTYEEIQQDPVKALARKKKHSKMMSENNPFKDKEHTADTKAVMKEKAKLRLDMTEEERNQVWGHLKGKPWSQARRDAQIKKQLTKEK